jgi:putative ABC transport system permease protein
MNLPLTVELLKKNINIFSFSSFTFIFSILIGVGSVTGINSYKNSLKNSILKESKNLMGADLSFESSRKLTSEQESQIAKVLPINFHSVNTVQFLSMLSSEMNGETNLSMVKAVGKGFPFYGELRTEPTDAYKNLKTNEILLDDSITKNLSLNLGDLIKLGEKSFYFRGIILKEPLSNMGGFSGMAPASIINIESLRDTGLEQRGSRIRYNTLIQLPDEKEIDAQEIKKINFNDFIAHDITIYHYTEVGSGTQKFIYSTLDYMILLGLSSFFLGAISILITVRTRLQSKFKEIAIFKCLGANSWFSIKIFLMEIMVLAFIGSTLGIALGYITQFFIPNLTGSEFLSNIRPNLDFKSVAWGIFIGIFIPLLLTLDSLYAIVNQSPLSAIRDETDRSLKLDFASRSILFLQVIFIYIIFFVIAYLETTQIFKAILLSAVLVVLPILIYIFYIFLRIFGRKVSEWGILVGTTRFILGKISKTGSGLSLPIVGIGSAISIILLSIIVRNSLILLGGWDVSQQKANMFIMDIKPDQINLISSLQAEYYAKEVYTSPVIGARLKKINNELIKKDNIDQESMNRDWKSTARTREYFLSFRDNLYDTEQISKGNFWKKNSNNEISVEKDFAKALGVGIGDILEFDIQGIDVSGKITNTREVNWSDMKPNFVVIFSKGDLENAPSNYISSFYISDAAQRVEFQRKVVKAYPNITIFDIEKTVAGLNSIFMKINSIIHLMTYFIFSSAIFVLFSSLYLQEKDRKQETALYKIVGAGSLFIRKIYTIEAIAVAVYSFVASSFLALVANYFISEWILSINYKIPFMDFFLVFLLSTLAILFVYLISIQRIIDIPPKKYLYTE